MAKVFLYQNIIPHYREHIFELLGKKYNLTVGYTDGTYKNGEHYKAVKTREIRIPKLGCIHTLSFWKEVISSDVIIAMLTTGNISVSLIKRFLKKKKLILWGIGVSAGYDVPFDSIPPTKNFIKLIERSDALIFYSSYPINKYSLMGINANKFFVANNTVKVKKLAFCENRNQYLFVGSLYMQKGVDVLIDAYAKAKQKNHNIFQLIIIGSGSEEAQIRNRIGELRLEDDIVLLGQITDEEILSKEFSKSLLCISPRQAGLTVLKSMGYGVAFVTNEDSITGGERLNIENNVNGILMMNEKQLEDILLDSYMYPKKYLDIGKKAYDYYWNCRKPEQMVEGFVKAISYVVDDYDE